MPRNSIHVLTLDAASTVLAQRPAGTSICDYYTSALLEDNSAENQYTLLTLLVNTAVIGNYTMPNVGVMVPGILAAGEYNGTEVELLAYFDGTLASTNTDGDSGAMVNFLDGGGAAPLMENKPAEDDSSRQYFLLTHLYQFFGGLLGCSQYGSGIFKSYQGDPSMFEVHKFMDLGPAEMGYFITQVGLAAASFGVAEDDVTAVGEALNSLFGLRCAPPAEVIPGLGERLNSMCINEECPLHPNATCAAYDTGSGGEDVGDNGDDTDMEPTPSETAAASGTIMPPPTSVVTAAAFRTEVGQGLTLLAAVFALVM